MFHQDWNCNKGSFREFEDKRRQISRKDRAKWQIGIMSSWHPPFLYPSTIWHLNRTKPECQTAARVCKRTPFYLVGHFAALEIKIPYPYPYPLIFRQPKQFIIQAIEHIMTHQPKFIIRLCFELCVISYEMWLLDQDSHCLPAWIFHQDWNCNKGSFREFEDKRRQISRKDRAKWQIGIMSSWHPPFLYPSTIWHLNRTKPECQTAARVCKRTPFYLVGHFAALEIKIPYPYPYPLIFRQPKQFIIQAIEHIMTHQPKFIIRLCFELCVISYEMWLLDQDQLIRYTLLEFISVVVVVDSGLKSPIEIYPPHHMADCNTVIRGFDIEWKWPFLNFIFLCFGISWYLFCICGWIFWICRDILLHLCGLLFWICQDILLHWCVVLFWICRNILLHLCVVFLWICRDILLHLSVVEAPSPHCHLWVPRPTQVPLLTASE